jgi:hypothetical protein
MTAQPRLAVLVGQGETWNTNLASVQRAWYQPGLACKLRQVCHVVEFESKHIRTKKVQITMRLTQLHSLLCPLVSNSGPAIG